MEKLAFSVTLIGGTCTDLSEIIDTLCIDEMVFLIRLKWFRSYGILRV